MKTLLIFSMAVAASQAFFLPSDFFANIGQQMREFRPHNPFAPRPSPETVNDPNYQRMSDLFNSLSPSEQAALKNYLFGQRFPSPLPASSINWESLTPEQIEAIKERQQFPRSLPQFQAISPAHHKMGHEKWSEEQIQEIREKFEAMTPEEREALKNERRKQYQVEDILNFPAMRTPKQFQAIRPLPEFIPNDKPLVRHPRSIQTIQPLPEFIDEPVKSPRSFQAIRPLPEFIDTPMVRNPRSFQAIRPLPEYFPNDKPLVRSPRPIQASAQNRNPRPNPEIPGNKPGPGGQQRPNIPDENKRPQGPGGQQRPTNPGENKHPQGPGGNKGPQQRPRV